jgi:SpoVK/Ycf46/Vps4 family AAA+-type ATPase
MMSPIKNKNPPLLRASRFCRPLIIPRVNRTEGPEEEDIAPVEQLRVRLQVLDHTPSAATATDPPNDDNNSVSNDDNDDSVVYLSSSSGLREASLVVGSLVCLQYQQRRIVVTLQQLSVLSRNNNNNNSNSQDSNSNQGNINQGNNHNRQLNVQEEETSSLDHDSSCVPVLYISPLAAANLACTDDIVRFGRPNCDDERDISHSNNNDNKNANKKSILVGDLTAYHPHPRHLSPLLINACDSYGSIPPATKVTLQCWRRPLPSFSTSGKQQQQQQQQQLPEDASTWPFPITGSMLQQGALIQARRRDGTSFLYQVLHVSSSNNNNNNSSSSYTSIGDTTHSPTVVYRVTRETRFRLETALAGGTSPQLPPTTTIRHCHSDGPRLSRSLLQLVPPHPDTAALVQAVTRIDCDAFTNERIVHVIGTDDHHHLCTAVEAAAAYTGRTCIVTAGLAATAVYQYGWTVTASGAGGWMDKLAGLEAAVTQAVAHAPSLLLIPDVTDELVSTKTDMLQRHDQEERFWSLLMERLSSVATTAAATKTLASTSYSRQLPQIPSVLVILSSRQPLTPGPLLQNLVGPSLTLSYPNRAYAEYLLQKEQQKQQRQRTTAHTTSRSSSSPWRSSSPSQHSPVVSSPPPLNTNMTDEVYDLLQGRSAREIQALLAAWMEHLLSSPDDVEDSYEHMHIHVDQGKDKQDEDDDDASGDTASAVSAISVLQKLCHERDVARRESGQARIAPVHWQDVGGLAHVRQEIMDAIELPLKYPHLFSTSSGRSGVLLYGPPGTGKTLVAKAVATECGLPFVSVKGPELLGSYVGESEAQVRAVFDQASQLALKNQPAACILFFDELDSLAPRRGDQASGGNVMDRVTATLFAELDKSRDGCSVLCMGATNRPDLLDPALLRPGRLDRLVYLGVSADDRARILATQIRKLRLETDDPDAMAAAIVDELPRNLTGADLSTIATGGLLRATERLCRQADDEISRLLEEGGEQVTVDEVLALWEEKRLEPVVTLQDLLESAKDVVPSVSAAELEKYESLRDQFRNSPA